MKWLIALIAVAICGFFISGIFFGSILNQPKTQPDSTTPVVEMLGSSVYASGKVHFSLK